MSRLSQTIAYLTADEVTQEDITVKFTAISIDKDLMKLRRQYRHAIKTKERIEKSVVDKEVENNTDLTLW
jgi:hypothetical protein|tara:strand:- start:896 stop:1105 length:210 start_codon:yes stop_codon:yes gene_type:complete